MEGMRCILSNAGLPKPFWAEGAVTVAYLINRCPSTALNFKTLEEVWTHSPSYYTRLKMFGCLAYLHMKQGKLEPRALKGIFLGYPKGVKSYKIWICSGVNGKCIISRDVIFNESEMLKTIKEQE